jgi:hypothetical protein
MTEPERCDVIWLAKKMAAEPVRKVTDGMTFGYTTEGCRMVASELMRVRELMEERLICLCQPDYRCLKCVTLGQTEGQDDD